jgi:hypothetical protein
MEVICVLDSIYYIDILFGGRNHTIVTKYCEREESFHGSIFFRLCPPYGKDLFDEREAMSSTLDDVFLSGSSYSNDNETNGISSRILFSFGIGLCIAVLSCTLFMLCSRQVDSFITSKLTRNRVFVVQYIDERCSSHISELETWTDTDCNFRGDNDTIVPSSSEEEVSFMKALLIIYKISHLMKKYDVLG